MKRYAWLLALGLWLAGCGRVSAPQVNLAAAGPTPTGTECGCTLKVTPFPTQPGGLVQAGPQVPAVQNPTAPTVDPTAEALAAYKDQWKTFTSAAGGYSFDYPAVYDSPAYRMCVAREGQSPAAAALGERTTITLAATRQDLAAAVAAFKSDPGHQAYRFEPPVERTVGGAAAVTLPYRSGSAGRYAEATFFIQGGTLYRVDSNTPSSCDVPALGLTELSAYAHALDTFRFK